MTFPRVWRERERYVCRISCFFMTEVPVWCLTERMLWQWWQVGCHADSPCERLCVDLKSWSGLLLLVVRWQLPSYLGTQLGGVRSTSHAAKRFIGIRGWPSPLAVLLVTLSLLASEPRPALSVILFQMCARKQASSSSRFEDCWRTLVGRTLGWEKDHSRAKLQLTNPSRISQWERFTRTHKVMIVAQVLDKNKKKNQELLFSLPTPFDAQDQLPFPLL